MLVYGWKLVDYPEKLGPEGQFYSPIIWESVIIMQNTHSLYEIDLSQITVLLLFNAINVDLTGKKGLWKYRGRSSSHILFKVSGVGFGLYF